MQANVPRRWTSPERASRMLYNLFQRTEGWLDERATALEILTSMKRAGADIIISYHAKDVARWIKESR